MLGEKIRGLFKTQPAEEDKHAPTPQELINLARRATRRGFVVTDSHSDAYYGTYQGKNYKISSDRGYLKETIKITGSDIDIKVKKQGKESRPVYYEYSIKGTVPQNIGEILFNLEPDVEKNQELRKQNQARLARFRAERLH